MTSKNYPGPNVKMASESENRILSVEEKIILEKQYVGYPKEIVGPSIGLFFHELTDKDTLSTRIFSKVAAGFLFALLVLLYPFVALAIKLSSRGPVIIRQTCTGFRGHPFRRYLFRTTKYNPESVGNLEKPEQTFFIGRVLRATRLNELPSVINILKNEMRLIGPKTRPYSLDTHWNNQFSEYYKRFATDPGLIGVSRKYRVEHTEDVHIVKYALRTELKYILQPTLPKDLKILVRALSTLPRRSARKA